MKKLFAFALLFAASILLNAQSLSPRWGSGPPTNDNTGRVLTYVFQNPTITAHLDTIKLTPNGFETIVIPANSVSDTTIFILKSISNCYAGDGLKFQFTNSSGSNHQIYFRNSGSGAVNGFLFLSSDSTITLTSAKQAYISFLFNGKKFFETGKGVQ